MDTNEAIDVCKAWFAHLDQQREKSRRIQELAVLARTDPSRARKELAQIDRAPRVFDGDRLEPAVKQLVKHLGRE